ncbi:myo-inositol transport ITR1 [Fusarium agapanthi]|uniref:Myo-inositol transport ITR1 n=1 Tax=Fusarium agapanthi TaxID=1803897 RepID=A0A9P5BFL0_9HYPO|nr:myo-inositol transport ITR1 [Fusarium agapanthi]
MAERELHADVRKFYQDSSQTLTRLRPYPTEREVQDASAIWHQKDNIEDTIRDVQTRWEKSPINSEFAYAKAAAYFSAAVV